jgi:hypothetical protein
MTQDNSNYSQVHRLYEAFAKVYEGEHEFAPLEARLVGGDGPPLMFGHAITGRLDEKRFIIQMSEWDCDDRGHQVEPEHATGQMLAIDVFLYDREDDLMRHCPIRSLDGPEGLEDLLLKELNR